MKSITRTEFDFPKQTSKYVGKVRDVYTIDDKYLVHSMWYCRKAFPTKGKY